ncbi:hypothetical protein MXD61_14615 [Frankia sp. AgPm24]|uniref:hypothetical protein n=1 Tax=Frankia sp. AgPm24 TaxID=631128 RepID=UPI00200DE383|nr:hypothetical protein [Frankia sp. AgPm24]MCK9923087.1 hypothetical protein [Frankia sp. AgPm24]
MFIGRRTTAALLLVSAVCGAGGLTVLRRAAGYPEVLTVSGTATLAAVQQHWFAVVAGLVLAVVGAALLVPITVGIVRLLPGGSHRPLPIVLATAASAAQLVGLLFWLFVVPALFGRSTPPALSDQATVVFDAARTLFAIMIGEVVACALTACWSVSLVLRVLRSKLLGRLPTDARRPRAALVGLGIWGAVASAGVLGGVLLPFGIHPAVTGRVVGQLLWSLWLVGLAVAVWQLDPRPPSPAAPTPTRPDFSLPAPHPPPPAAGPSGSAAVGSASSPETPLEDAFFEAITHIEPRTTVDAPACEPPTSEPLTSEPLTSEPSASEPPSGTGEGPSSDDPMSSGVALRAAPQPAGRAIGNDDPTELGILTPPSQHTPAPTSQ